MTYTASLHQGAIELRWLHLCQKTFVYEQCETAKKEM